jgi:hypothetical protein
MNEMKIGLRGIERMVVQSQDLASVFGNIGADVLSTHRVV